MGSAKEAIILLKRECEFISLYCAMDLAILNIGIVLLVEDNKYTMQYIRFNRREEEARERKRRRESKEMGSFVYDRTYLTILDSLVSSFLSILSHHLSEVLYNYYYYQ